MGKFNSGGCKITIESLLLLSCRSAFLDDDKIYPPLANLYLHQSIMKSRPDVRVDVREDYNLEDGEWAKPYDAIGVSIMTPQREEANKILRFLKDRFPDKKTIAGGPHIKYYLNDVLDDDWDFIVPDDGERAILKIIDGTDERVVRDYIHPKDFKKIAVKPARIENFEFLDEFRYILNDRPSTTMLTARGCPEKCTFCEDAETLVRYTPFDLIREELDDIQELGYRGVYIFDDIFSLIQKKAEPVARELKKRDLVYRCNGQARLFNEDFARMLSETGCAEIAFGAETGSQKILDNIRKRTTVEQNYNFVRLCKKYNIPCKGFILLGLPGEDMQTLYDTEKFIRNTKMDDFQCAIYYPYKGTQIRDEIDRGGDSDINFMGEGLGAYGQAGGATECVVSTSSLSQEQLVNFRNYLVSTYRPKSHGKFFDTHMEVKVE